MKRNVSVVRFKFRCNIPISGKIIKEIPGSVASGTPCTVEEGFLFKSKHDYVMMFFIIMLTTCFGLNNGPSSGHGSCDLKISHCQGRNMSSE